MKRALWIAGLMLVSASLLADGTDLLAADPTQASIEVRETRKAESSEPGHPVPEAGTMAITSMGLLAAAAFRRNRSSR